MSDRDLNARELLSSVEAALELLLDYTPDVARDGPAEPLPSLLEQCEALTATLPPPAFLRSIHHMACSGGSVISKCLAVMPNTTLLSEIDPLSPLGLPQPKQTPQFRPHDLIYGLRVALRDNGEAIVAHVFEAALGALYADLVAQGQYLCIRDHAHSQYCTRTDWRTRPTVHSLLERVAPVRSVVTVRHPIDSFLSLEGNAWLHFTPATIDEYARRYHAFLDDHAALPLVRYEDFVADPEAILQQLCSLLDLPYMPGAEDFLSVVRISGDSGRSGTRIAPRPRRIVHETLQTAIDASDALAALCARLDYDL